MFKVSVKSSSLLQCEFFFDLESAKEWCEDVFFISEWTNRTDGTLSATSNNNWRIFIHPYKTPGKR